MSDKDRQDAGEPQLDWHASDPVTLGWMVGSPPPPGKRIRFADGSFYQFPQTRWSYSNVRQLMPTRAVPRGNAPVVMLPRAERDDLDAVTFTPIGGEAPMTWAESLAANYTDGILVLHEGRIVYERYFGALGEHQQHIAFSVTKSFVATLAGMLVHEGVVDESAAVSRYVPELAASGFGDATVRQLLDMTTGLNYTEDYADDFSSIWEFSRAGNFRPRPAGYAGPDSSFEYLQTVAKEYPHGERFKYKTVNTDALGWVMRAATGKSLGELMRARFWETLGVEQDAYFTIDTAGVEFAGGGLNLTLRDMARFGELMRMDGTWHGRTIVPKAVVDEVRRGGDREQFARADYAMLPGWSYRRMWWVSHNEHGAYTARGIHGQAIYIDPAAKMVIARFASHPLGANMHLDPTSLPAYHAVAKRLRGAGG